MDKDLYLSLKQWAQTEPIINAALNEQMARGLTNEQTLQLIISTLIQVKSDLLQKVIDKQVSPVITVHCHNPGECWFKQRGEHTTPVDTHDKYGQHS